MRFPSTDSVDELLPQTQCRQCGFDGCREYARALAAGNAAPNRCAPGGNEGIRAICALLGVAYVPLDPEYGHEAPFAAARVDSSRCIGCGLCARACPVGAFTGIPKRLFAVIEEMCTGCALCVAPCPMDCIGMIENGRSWGRTDARRARRNYDIVRARRIAARSQEDARKERAAAGKARVLAEVMARVKAMNPVK